MIQKATPAHILPLAKLACALWPSHSLDEMAGEMAALLDNPAAACFLAYEGAEPVGFAQCQLRRDYVEGTESSPVGYLEGIYVMEAYRHQGRARALLSACQQWAMEMDCREFASDCEIDNAQSLAFHLAMGFQEANRIICFTKKLP